MRIRTLNKYLDTHHATTEDTPIDRAQQEILTASKDLYSLEHCTDQIEKDIQDLTQIERGLEAVYVDISENTLTPIASTFASHAVNRHHGQLGLEQVDDTTISAEGVGESLKKIWVAIVEAIKKLIHTVTDFFRKLFSNIKKLRRKLENTRSELTKLQGQPDGVFKVKKPESLVFYDPDTKRTRIDGEAINAGLTNLTWIHYYLTDIYLEAAMGDIGQVTDLITALEKQQASTIENIISSFTAVAKLNPLRSLKTLFVFGDFREKVKRVGEYPLQFNALPGGAHLDITYLEVGGKTATLKIRLEKNTETYRNLGNKTTIKVPDKATLLKSLDLAIRLTEEIEDSDKVIDDGIERYKFFSSSVTKSRKLYSGGGVIEQFQDAGEVKITNTLISKVSLIARLYSRDLFAPIRQTAAHSWRVCLAVDDYVNDAMKHYK